DFMMASSFDGGATFAPSARVTSGSSWWEVSADAIPNFGDQFRPEANGNRLHLAWADGRNGDPDVRFTALGTGFVLTTPTQASVHIGQGLGLTGTLRNDTPYDDAMFLLQVDSETPSVPDSSFTLGPVPSGAEVAWGYDPVVAPGMMGVANLNLVA